MYKSKIAIRLLEQMTKKVQKLRLTTSAPIAATLMLAVCFSSCKPNYQEEYEKKCLELEIKTKQLNYLRDLYNTKSDIEYSQKVKELDSLINKAKYFLK